MITGDREAPGSQWADLDDLGGPVHYVDHGGPADGPLLVCVHGLGGSLVNWAALAPRLTDVARVVAEPAVLVGNSMGGLIVTLQAQAGPDTVAGVVLIDPALPLAVGARPDPFVTAVFAMYAVPPVGRAALQARRRRRSPEQVAMDILRLCCVDPDRVPNHVLDQHVELARTRRTYDEVDDAMLEAARSLMWALARRRRHAAMLASMRGPVLLLHGDKDRLVPIGSARAAARANPGWRFEVADGVGHVPQLEVPDWTAARIRDWLDTDARGATA